MDQVCTMYDSQKQGWSHITLPIRTLCQFCLLTENAKQGSKHKRPKACRKVTKRKFMKVTSNRLYNQSSLLCY